MVEDVGEGSFNLEAITLGNGKGLVESSGEVDESGTFNDAIAGIAEAADGQRMLGAGAKGLALSSVCVEAGTGVAAVARGPGGIPGAGECRGVDPHGAFSGAGFPADSRHLISVLRTVGGIPAFERVVEAGACAGGVALSIRKVGHIVVACLEGEDAGEAPAADEGVGDVGHTAADLLAAADGQIVESGGVPAQTAGAEDIAEICCAVNDGGGAAADAFPCEPAVGWTLVIGQVLGPGEGGVVLEAVLEAVRSRELERVIALVGARHAVVDATPVGG